MQEDNVNHPKHYADTELRFVKPECIMFTRNLPFCTGNAVKYVWRAGHKGNWQEDLAKARWYLNNATVHEMQNHPDMARLNVLLNMIDYDNIKNEWFIKLKLISAILVNNITERNHRMSELESWFSAKELGVI